MPEKLFPYILISLGAYIIGSVPWAFIIGKCKGIDIREHGSGNIGATNVRRTLGKKFGILCFFLDFMKGFVPVLTVLLLIKYDIFKITDIAVILASFASVFGHMWPVFLKFKGGKGVSTIAGILLAIAPLSLICGGIIWALIFYTSRYVSLASILAAVFLPLSAYFFSKVGVYSLSLTLQLMLVVMAVLVVVRHLGNIKRLLNGTENRFVKKEKSSEQENEDSSSE